MSKENSLNGVVLSLKVLTNCKGFKAEFDEAGCLKLKTKSKAIQGKANQEIEKELKKLFKTRVQIIQGLKSKNKKLFVENKSTEELFECLK